MEINVVGIIGAGQMGSGIAQVCASSGLNVRITDITEAQLQKGIAMIERNLARQVSKGTIDEDKQKEIIALVTTNTSYEPFNTCDIVIETASENEALKHDIFKKLIPHLNKKALIATNTSSISITRLAAITDRPSKFMGVHFMNPVPVMKLVELIRGIATDEETFNTIQDFIMKIGKISSVAEDFPAFIVNRILIPMINEAVYALHEGVGSIRDIDTGLKLGANHPMGPLELADFIGLDTCLAIMKVLYSGLSDSKYRPCPLLIKYVEAGWLGRKAGYGFYDYRGEKPIPTR